MQTVYFTYKFPALLENLNPRTFKTILKNSVTDAYKKIGKQMVSHIKENIVSGKKSGKIYRNLIDPLTSRYKLFHVSSAPFQFPAKFSGALSSSIGMRIEGMTLYIGSYKKGSFLSLPISLSNYPKFLEEGSSKMQPRPYLAPTAETFKKDIQREIFKNIKQRLQVAKEV